MCLPDSDDFIQLLFGKMSLPFTAGRLLYQECALVAGDVQATKMGIELRLSKSSKSDAWGLIKGDELEMMTIE